MNLTIKQEFKDLLPRQSDAELAELESSILASGCREPIIYWIRDGVPTIIDGHTRYEICHRNKTPFSTQEMKFLSDDDAKQWIITNQVGRRNLTPRQKEAALASQLEYRSRLGDALEPPKPGKITMKEAAAAGISNDTASKLNQISEHAPELLTAVADGEISVNKAHKKAKGEIEEEVEATEEGEDKEIAGEIISDLKDICSRYRALSLRSERYAKHEKTVNGSIRQAITFIEQATKARV